MRRFKVLTHGSRSILGGSGSTQLLMRAIIRLGLWVLAFRFGLLPVAGFLYLFA